MFYDVSKGSPDPFFTIRGIKIMATKNITNLLQVTSMRDFFAYIYNSRKINRVELLRLLNWHNYGLMVRLKAGFKETDIEHFARCLNLSDDEIEIFIKVS